MGGFLYFRSGDTRPIGLDGVTGLGLGYILDDGSSIETRQVNAGSPSGKAGLVFADSSRHDPKHLVGINLAEQVWREMPASGDRAELWIGYWKDSKPVPDDLARPSMLRGPKLKMADGNAWQVPIVRRYDESLDQWESELPAILDYDKQGHIIRGKPLEKYKQLWDITAVLAGEQFERDSGENIEIDDQQVYRAVVALLQANYVVALPELVILEALADDDSLSLVALASCRYDQLMKWIEASDQKKSESSPGQDGLTMSDGEAA